MAVAVTLLLSLLAAPPTAAQAAGENDGRLRVTTPRAATSVSNEAAEVRGTVDAASGAGQVNVMFAVDLSGSTSFPSDMDCNGDGTVDQGDDFNSDGARGDVLDCEISGVLAVNAQLRALPRSADNVRVGITGFGSYAATADMSPSDDSVFVGPGQTGNTDDEVTPWVGQVLSSMTAGYVGAFTQRSVSTGTNFDNAVSTAVTALEAQNGPRYLFFLSDGQSSVSSTTLNRLAASDITARTFAVGTGTGGGACTGTAPLASIATAGSGTCTVVTNPANLTAAIAEAPSTVDSVLVDAVGQSGVSPVSATIDALGNYSAVLRSLPIGPVTIRVQAKFTDGTTETDTVDVYSAYDKFTYVALGDSYASGEGVEPYLGQDPESSRATNRDFLCHRSRDSWPRQIRRPGQASTIAAQASSNPAASELRFRACSGARTVHADTVQQSKKYRDNSTQLIPLQYESLDPAVDLVTVSMGGNDLDFAGVAEHCVKHAYCYDDEYLTTSSGRKVTLNQWAEIRLALLSAELEGFYGGIKNRVSPETDVVATTYPRLLSKDFNVTNDLCAAVGNDETDWLWRQIDTAAEVIKYRAGRTGVRVADVRDTFNDHLACERGDSWLYALEARRGTDLEAGSGDWWKLALLNSSAATLHPNAKGATAYAGVVNDTLAASGARAARSAKAPSQAATTDQLVAEEIDPLVVTDPAAVLAKYPSEVVEAVEKATSVTVALGRGAPGAESCNAVVANERVPVVVEGLAPNSNATLSIDMLNADGTAVGATKQLNTTADADGIVAREVVVPSTAAAAASFGVAGSNAAGGSATGSATVELTGAPECVSAVTVAGYLGERPAATPPASASASAPASVAKPRVTGKVKVGRKVTASAGTWTGVGDLSFAYKWRIGSKVLGATGQSLRVPAKAAGRRVSVEVTATRPGFAAVSARSDNARVRKVKSRVKANVTSRTDGRFLAKVKVRAQHNVSVTGRLVFKVDGAKAATIWLKKAARGKATVLLPRLEQGEHRLRVVYAGSRSIAASRTRRMPTI